ncbi:unnamed protein product [Anisakis simplex]|uniref:Uncharacterized protein n=1 Tax=Anisakis simplex TaxID=6269 RepID=A0A0M3JZK6_ANISI|nr:unnamed protein product [Anisakis simplex]
MVPPGAGPRRDWNRGPRGGRHDLELGNSGGPLSFEAARRDWRKNGGLWDGPRRGLNCSSNAMLSELLSRDQQQHLTSEVDRQVMSGSGNWSLMKLAASAEGGVICCYNPVSCAGLLTGEEGRLMNSGDLRRVVAMVIGIAIIFGEGEIGQPESLLASKNADHSDGMVGYRGGSSEFGGSVCRLRDDGIWVLIKARWQSEVVLSLSS